MGGWLTVVSEYQHADAAMGKTRHNGLNVVHRDRVDAGERLVQQHELGLGDERPGDLEAAALAARQLERLLTAQGFDRELVEQALEPLMLLALVDGQRLGDRQDVPFPGALAEPRPLLRQAAD